MLTCWYQRSEGQRDQECFYVETGRPLISREATMLEWLLKAPLAVLSRQSWIRDEEVVEIGPRLGVETPFSSNAVAICQSMGLPVVRIEVSTRYALFGTTKDAIVAKHLDRMTQEVYPQPLTTFDVGHAPEPVREVDVLARGTAALREENARLGLGFDKEDIVHYVALFCRLGRNPTDVELFQIANGNSEHSRHHFWRGHQWIDGILMPHTLMDLVRAPLAARKGNHASLAAFNDNAGVIRGPDVRLLVSSDPRKPSSYTWISIRQHLSATAETHNHPTLIAPFQGAETGVGGRVRDSRAVGRGGLVHAGLAGYCMGNLHIPGHTIPGEMIGGEKCFDHASPLDILVKGSAGVHDYANKYGEPLIGGFLRTFGQQVNGRRREFRKPVLYTAGLGRIRDENVRKRSPQKGMLIVSIGGPAFRIGVGGGSASSMNHGTQSAELDFNSVQRGDAQTKNRVNRVIQACAEMGMQNPILSIHDQGAGGPSNVVTELMELVGGRVDIRKITVGDTTMSVLHLWVAEYQERYALLLHREALAFFHALCARERVNCEVLGEITGDGHVVVVDSSDNTTPVNLPLKDILGEVPRKMFTSTDEQDSLPPLVIPNGLTVEEALRMVFLLPSVASKGHLVHGVDRSVTGLVVRQPCCGPFQVPVADVGVTADSYCGLTGAAASLGEQPIKMLISPNQGARMAVAEMLTNMAGVAISGLRDISCRANWMWPAKLPYEGEKIFRAAKALRDIMIELGIVIDGGKDSLSMVAKVNGEQVAAPGQLVVYGYAPVPDITKIATPDLKGGNRLGWITCGGSYHRLGGSALAQALGQLGNESPDIDDVGYLGRAFQAMQELIKEGFVSAYHDVSDGGLITTITEMCIAGNRGVRVSLASSLKPLEYLFAEEAGMVFEYDYSAQRSIRRVLKKHNVDFSEIGVVDKEQGGWVRVLHGRRVLLRKSISELRQWWEATSNVLKDFHANPPVVSEEVWEQTATCVPEYRLTFELKAPMLGYGTSPKVAVVREEGTNGDREMVAAFLAAGFETVVDIKMSDFRDGYVRNLDDYRGVVFPGGFSYADVLGSAKGWAGPILFNPRLEEIFGRFYERPDTFSLGVCNGCQLMANIGWAPYKGIFEGSKPRLLHNLSGRFESRWVSVRIAKSPSIMLAGMEDSILGVNVAHGEGRFHFPDQRVADDIWNRNLASLVYVDAHGNATEGYPDNPNGSPKGLAAICSPNGRHLAMMPHPERSHLMWQWPWVPEHFRNLKVSPWLQMFQNALDWCRRV